MLTPNYGTFDTNPGQAYLYQKILSNLKTKIFPGIQKGIIKYTEGTLQILLEIVDDNIIAPKDFYELFTGLPVQVQQEWIGRGTTNMTPTQKKLCKLLDSEALNSGKLCEGLEWNATA